MPSKGIAVYGFVGAENCKIEFGVPGNSITKDQFKQWSQDHLEVDSSKIDGKLNFKGRFYFKVWQGDQEIANKGNDINSMTGGVADGDMKTIRDTRCIRTNGLIVMYGFYDAGHGEAGLTNMHQCWVTVTPERGDWMGDIVPAGSSKEDRPFSNFVLPCPHDCGMNSLGGVERALNGATKEFLTTSIGTIPVVGALLGKILEAGTHIDLISNIVYGLAITQKEEIEDLLTLGARYFEFRPGRFPPEVRKDSQMGEDFYFMHACIPGLAYGDFLNQVLGFLEQHQREIIVVQLRNDGIIDKVEKASGEDKQNMINDALGRHQGVQAGGVDDIRNLSVKQLREQGKRLIVIDGVDQYSSYTDEDYATLDGKSIPNALAKLNAGGQSGKPMTLLQCQATATNDQAALKYSIVTSDASTSLLMSSKAQCDVLTQPWLVENVLKNLTDQQLIVIMNDFLDGATVTTAVDMSAQRFPD